MFGSKNRAIIAQLTYEKRCLGEELEAEQFANSARLKEIAETGVALTNAKTELRIAAGRIDYLTAERDKLAAELKPYLARREQAKLNLKQFQPKPNGAAVQGVAS